MSTNITELLPPGIDIVSIPYFSYLQELINSLEILIGGIFGLYLIYLIFVGYQTYKLSTTFRQLNRTLAMIRDDLETKNNKGSKKKKSNNKKFHSKDKNLKSKFIKKVKTIFERI